MELRTELPEEIVGWVSDAARRFNVTHSEIVHRALELYLGRVEEIRVASERRRQPKEQPADVPREHKFGKKEDCPYADCPFGNACPGETCSL